MTVPTPPQIPEQNTSPKLLPDEPFGMQSMHSLSSPGPNEESSSEQAKNPSKPVIGGLLNHFGIGSSAGEGAAAGGAEDVAAAAL